MGARASRGPLADTTSQLHRTCSRATNGCTGSKRVGSVKCISRQGMPWLGNPCRARLGGAPCLIQGTPGAQRAGTRVLSTAVQTCACISRVMVQIHAAFRPKQRCGMPGLCATRLLKFDPCSGISGIGSQPARPTSPPGTEGPRAFDLGEIKGRQPAQKGSLCDSRCGSRVFTGISQIHTCDTKRVRRVRNSGVSRQLAIRTISARAHIPP